mgnify:CR=1 FL=1
MSDAPVTLDVRHLRTRFHTRAGVLPVVEDLVRESFLVDPAPVTP